MRKLKMADETKSLIVGISKDVSNLKSSFEEFKRDQKEIIEKLDNRMGLMEVAQARTNERVSNMTIFQGAFSIVIGAIATYLGVQRQ